MFYFRLLDVLADRKAEMGLSGHVLINEKRQPHNFKCVSAYVVQVGISIDSNKIHTAGGVLACIWLIQIPYLFRL